MPFEIICGDITTVKADAVVNAANSGLLPGGGVCGAIFRAAGYDKLDRACRAIGHCDTGRAVITDGFSLPARYVIHTVGPVWQGGGHHEEALLKSCYTSSLQLAEENGCRSIAFPLISSGIFGYPKAEALQVAVSAISGFLAEHEMRVILTVFTRGAVELSDERMRSIRAYIAGRYAESELFFSRDEAFTYGSFLEEEKTSHLLNAPAAAALPAKDGKKRSLKDLLGSLDESFSKMLLRLIDEKGMTDVEVYKRANLDRKLFSKIRRDGYSPSKQTAIALAIALRLNLDETRDLLSRAGYALSRSSKFDVIIEYFIVEGTYDIYEINEALFAFDQRLLGA